MPTRHYSHVSQIDRAADVTGQTAQNGTLAGRQLLVTFPTVAPFVAFCLERRVPFK